MALERCEQSRLLKNISELWLYKGTADERRYRAEFIGVKTREKLIRDYGYPGGDDSATKNTKDAKRESRVLSRSSKPHATHYALFKTELLYRHKNDLPGEADAVIVRLKDFARTPKVRKQLREYLESPDRNDPDLAKRLPSIVTSVPPERLRVCECFGQITFISKLFPANADTMAGKAFSAISLFSGAGGMDIGVEQAGFAVKACVEIDHNCCNTLRNAIESRHLDTHVVEGDIRKIDIPRLLDEVGLIPGKVDLLFGGPPCQAFSLIGKQLALDDERGMLLFQMVRFAEAMRPKVILMEQVKGVLSAKDRKGERGGVFRRFVSELEGLGYTVKYKVCLAADYGVAQKRERVFLVGTRDGNGFVFPAPSYYDPASCDNIFPNHLAPYKTVGDVLAGLGEPVAKGNESGAAVPNHIDVTPQRDRERIHFVVEGGHLSAQKDAPPEVKGRLSPKDTTKFLRLDRSRPSNTLRCGEIFFHPTEDRYLTPREYMRIHGYPDSYVLIGPIKSRCGSVKQLDQHRQVANSVPPPMARAIAQQIMNYLKGDK